MKIKGCIIQNAMGNYLPSDKYVWYPHEDPSEAYVHPIEKVKEIIHVSKDWEYKPTSLTMAEYDSVDEKTTLLSEPHDIRNLNTNEILLWLEGKK